MAKYVKLDDIMDVLLHEQYGYLCEEPIEAIPAIEIPPHGRLIDADALKVSLAFAEKTAEWAVPAIRAVLMVIDEMPTIISAEEARDETLST